MIRILTNVWLGYIHTGDTDDVRSTERVRTNVLLITRYNRLKIGMDDVGSIVEPTSSLAWADVIQADFQTVISRYLQNINIRHFCTADRMLRIIIMQTSRLI